MTVVVENLEKLERKITLTMPVAAIQGEVDVRLRKLARTVKMDGFRPGKVPMNVVAQRYGYSVQYEVVNDKVGQAFSAAANEAKLRVAGQPSITQATAPSDDEMAFDAVFEVFPEVKIASLSDAVVEKVHADKALGAARHRRQFGDRDGGGVGRDDRFWGEHAVELLDDLDLEVVVLSRRFNHELRDFEVVVAGAGFDA